HPHRANTVIDPLARLRLAIQEIGRGSHGFGRDALPGRVPAHAAVDVESGSRIVLRQQLPSDVDCIAPGGRCDHTPWFSLEVAGSERFSDRAEADIRTPQAGADAKLRSEAQEPLRTGPAASDHGIIQAAGRLKPKDVWHARVV